MLGWSLLKLPPLYRRSINPSSSAPDRARRGLEANDSLSSTTTARPRGLAAFFERAFAAIGLGRGTAEAPTPSVFAPGLSAFRGPVAGTLIGASALGLGSGAALAQGAPPEAPPSVQLRVLEHAPRTRTVVKGDTLSAIALAERVLFPDLVAKNPAIKNPDRIYPGQKLILPEKKADPLGSLLYPTPPATTPEPTEASHFEALAAFLAAEAPPPVRATEPVVASPPAAVVAAPEAVIAAPAAVTAAASPAAVVAAPAAVAAAASAATPEEDAVRRIPLADGPSSLLPKILRSPAWRSLTDRTIGRTIPVDLGPLGTGEARVHGRVESGWDDLEQLRISSAINGDGQRLLWLKSDGTLELPGTILDTSGSAGAGSTTLKGSLGYTVSRPYRYVEGREDPIGLARALATNTVSLPLTAERALRLEPGSKLVLEGQVEVSDSRSIVLSSLDASAKGHLRLEIQRGAGSKVTVRLTIDDKLAGKLKHDLPLTIEAEFSDERMRSFTLDLSELSGRLAFRELIALNGSGAAKLAAIPGSGVVLDLESAAKNRAITLDTELGRTPEERLHGRLSLSDARTLESHTRSHDLSAGIGRSAPGGRAIDLNFGATGSSSAAGSAAAVDLPLPSSASDLLALPSGVRGSVESARRLGASVDASPDLRINVGTERTSRLSRYIEGGDVIETGRLDGGLELKTKLGVKGNGALSYRLEVPLAQGDAENTALPLDAARAARLPEGARFRLVREGTLSVARNEVLTGVLRHTSRLGLSADKTDRISVTKGAGSLVEVSVDTLGHRERGTTLGYGRGDSETTGFDLELSASSSDRSSRTLSLSLDLDQPAHREAYEALLGRDEARALVLAGKSSAETSLEHSGALGGTLTLRPSEGWNAAIELGRRTLPGSDSRVTWDGERLAFDEALKAKGGVPSWIETNGSVSPRVDVGVPGPIGLRHSVSARGLIQYKALVPATDVAVVPLTPADALRLSRGSEVSLHVEGRGSASVGYGAGSEWSAPGVTLSATAGVDARTSKTKSFDLIVKRLSGDKVQVEVGLGDRAEAAVELAARLGIKVELAGFSGGATVFNRNDVLRGISHLLDDELSRRPLLELSAARTVGDQSERNVRLELDLSTTVGQTAYRALLDLDIDAPLGLAGASLGARPTEETKRAVLVSSATLDTSHDERDSLRFSLFGSRGYLSEALRSDGTRIEVRDSQVERTDRSSFKGSGRSLLGRERSTTWEAVTVRTTEDPVGKGFYRLSFTDADPLTSEDQARSLLLLGESLRGAPAPAARLEEDGARGLAKIFGRYTKHGPTKAEVEAFFTEKGVHALRAYDREATMSVYGSSVAHRLGGKLPSWVQPKIAQKAREILERWEQLSSAAGEEVSAREQARVEYWYLTHHNIYDDAPDYHAAKSFVRAIERMRGSEDPVEWNKAYADLGNDVRFGFYDALDAMSRMAGKEEVLVSTLRMKGRAVDIELSDPSLVIPQIP